MPLSLKSFSYVLGKKLLIAILRKNNDVRYSFKAKFSLKSF